MQERQRVEQIVAAAQETKAEQIVLYDMENRSPITDYVLICNGRSQAHVRGIAAQIEAALKKAGVRSHSIEGQQEGSWVLLDYDVVIVHVFHPETRQYYDLDGLFSSYAAERFGTHAPLRHGSPEDAAASA